MAQERVGFLGSQVSRDWMAQRRHQDTQATVVNPVTQVTRDCLRIPASAVSLVTVDFQELGQVGSRASAELARRDSLGLAVIQASPAIPDSVVLAGSVGMRQDTLASQDTQGTIPARQDTPALAGFQDSVDTQADPDSVASPDLE